MLRTLAWSVLLLLALAMPATDVMAQSSAGRGAVGGAIIGGAVGGRRGALLASRSLLGAQPRKIASRGFPLLQVEAPAIRSLVRCSFGRDSRIAGQCLLLGPTR